MRRSAHEGLNPRLAWWEWVADYGHDIDDRDLWLRVNPAVASGRVGIQAILDDRAVLPLDQFRAERLSMWRPTGGARVFEADPWQALTDPTSTPATDLALGLDCPPSREYATVCLAGRRTDGLLHVEWYHMAEGVRWIPEWVADHLTPTVRAVVVDARNPLAELDWRAAGIAPTLAGTRDVAAAAGTYFDAITEGRARHRGQVELTRATLGARQRPMIAGEGFGWDRRAPGSSTLYAASLAVWGIATPTAEKPQRRMRTGAAVFR